MSFIKKTTQLIAYKKQVKIQLNALATNNSFTPEDKKFFADMYNKMLERCEKRIEIISKDVNVLQLKKN